MRSGSIEIVKAVAYADIPLPESANCLTKSTNYCMLSTGRKGQIAVIRLLSICHG